MEGIQGVYRGIQGDPGRNPDGLRPPSGLQFSCRVNFWKPPEDNWVKSEFSGLVEVSGGEELVQMSRRSHWTPNQLDQINKYC